MACHLIAQVKVIVLLFKTQRSDAGCECCVAFKRPFLAPIGGKGIDQNSKWHTRFAAVAVGPVGEQPTAPKPLTHKLRVSVALNEVARRCDLGPGLMIC